MVLVKEFRAEIPACTTADTGHTIDRDVHQFFSVSWQKQIGGIGIKGYAWLS
jgi:hypothetical protein